MRLFYWHFLFDFRFGQRDNTYSVRGIELCIEHFEKLGYNVKAIVPEMRLKKHMSSDPAKLNALEKADKVWLTPCKNLPGNMSTCYDDRFILQIAEKFDGAVISRDYYRDLLNENPSVYLIYEW